MQKYCFILNLCELENKVPLDPFPNPFARKQKKPECGYETLRYVHYFSYLKVQTHLSCSGEGVGPYDESARDFVQPDGA
jgi:hypothetical protein